MDSTPLEDPTQTNEAKLLENKWSKTQLQELTEQMGLISSDTKTV